MRWGKSIEETNKAKQEKADALLQWHKAFAWAPHRTTTSWVWLEWAERKGTWYAGSWEDGSYLVFDWRVLS